MSDPVEVTSPYGWLTASGAIGSFFILLGIAIRQVNPWRKQTIEADQKLRDDLLNRVEKLEGILERKDALHAAERALDRHRINNVTQCLDALLLLLEQDPSKAAEAVSRIKEMRARQLEAEALEKATIHAAEIVAKNEPEGKA